MAARARAAALLAVVALAATLLVRGGAFCLGAALRAGTPAASSGAGAANFAGAGQRAGAAAAGSPASAAGLAFAAALAACAVRAAVARRAAQAASNETSGDADIEAGGRRGLLAAAATLAGLSQVIAPASARVEEAAPKVDVPDRITADPYELIGMTNPDDDKADKKEFYMKKKYRQDTYQVVKHMKISGSLDKGTPNMERWNKRVKEEMNDWVALYRRQDLVVGRQSYYSLYSAINTLASHFTSYGPKFPFPSKRRARFYELINTTEKYLEKGK